MRYRARSKLESTTHAVYYGSNNYFRENWYSGTSRSFIYDENHHGAPRSTEGGDVGGYLYSLQRKYTETGRVWAFKKSNGDHGIAVIAPALASFTDANFPNLWATPTPESVLLAKGTTAIARCTPTNPVSGASNFLGELKRDGLPAIVGSPLFKERSKSFLQRSGNEYLNLEFGWKPFVSDILKFRNAVTKTDKILAQLQRDSGKNVRRRYDFPTSTSDVIVRSTPGNLQGQSWGMVGGASGWYSKRTFIETKMWFVGCFTYHLDLGNSAWSKLHRFEQESNKLYGTRITPSVLWNLAPWSWAVDWFGNYGDIATNISNFSADGLVMRYGYIMEQVTHSISHTVGGKVDIYGKAIPETTQTFATVTKRRIAASPYGFGLSWSSFTPRQLAITAALGVTQGGARFSK